MRGRSRPSNTTPRSTSVPLMKPNSQIDSAIWVANSFVSALRRPLTLTCIGRGGRFYEQRLRNRAGCGARSGLGGRSFRQLRDNCKKMPPYTVRIADVKCLELREVRYLRSSEMRYLLYLREKSTSPSARSEERRVGKECRSRW